MLTGVVEVGLFCKMARACYFGNEVRDERACKSASQLTNYRMQDGTVTVKWNDGRVQKIDADRTP